MNNKAETKTTNADIAVTTNKIDKLPVPQRIRIFAKKHWLGYAFLLPFLLMFILFTVVPVFYAMILSFTDYNMLQDPNFVGLNNYKLLFLDDKVFITAINNTLVFALITGPIGYLASFFAAWVINQLKFKKGFSLAFYAPSITSGVAMSYVWLIVFSSDRYGYLNNFLINIGLIDSPILWNTDPEYIMTVVIIISLWMSMGNGFLVFLAGFQNLDPSIYEAGAIDGVRNKFQELIYLTLPQMKPQLLFGAVNSIVGSFAVFDVAVSVAGMPSPNYAGHTIVAHLYDYAFIRFQMGYASAVAVVLFVLTFTLGKVVFRMFASDDE